MPGQKRAFSTVSHTRPSAEEALAPAEPADATAPDVGKSRRRDVQPPPAPEAERPAAPSPTAFTWRQTPDEAEALDLLVLRFRRELGRRKTKAEVLAALVQLATDREDVRAALLEALRAE
jgi:hypothetical protein